MRHHDALALAFGLGMLAAACGPTPSFGCTDDTECERSRELGWCEGGYCAFMDSTCPTLHRWGEHAPEGIASECVPWDGGDPTAAGGGKGADGGAPSDSSSAGEGEGEGESDGDGGDGGATTGDDGAPVPTDGEPGWICATDDLYGLDPVPGDGLLPGGWTIGATGTAEAVLVRTEAATTLHLESGAPGSMWIERELDVGDDAIAVLSGVELVGLYAQGWLELTTDTPHRIERQGTRVTILAGDDADAAPILDAEIDPALSAHLRIVVEDGVIRYEASADGTSFVELAWHPHDGDAPPTTVSIGLQRLEQSPLSDELVFKTVSTCAPV